MKFWYDLYRIFSTSVISILFPLVYCFMLLSAKHNKSIKQRLGFIQIDEKKSKSGYPRIWIHAVSVGEVSVAKSLIDEITHRLPNCSVIVTCTTNYGYRTACKTLQNKTLCLYAPLDFVWAVNNFLNKLKPDLLICLETEIWPNWIITAKKRKIKIAIVNGRISGRSIGKYKKIRSLIKYVLARVDLFSMISNKDAERIKSIGAPDKRVVIHGNAKYDNLNIKTDSTIKLKIKTQFNIKKNDLVFVAGSTRTGEEEIIIDVYKKILQKFPHLILILVPRHVERCNDIASIITDSGLSFQLKSEFKDENRQRDTQVVLVDTIGELLNIYSAATVAFCGASLVPLGGQNMLEPAMWSKPVFYGRSTEDFTYAASILEQTGGGIRVNNKKELYEKIIYLLDRPEKLKKTGELAKKAVCLSQGASKRHADEIYKLFS